MPFQMPTPFQAAKWSIVAICAFDIICSIIALFNPNVAHLSTNVLMRILQVLTSDLIMAVGVIGAVKESLSVTIVFALFMLVSVFTWLQLISIAIWPLIFSLVLMVLSSGFAVLLFRGRKDQSRNQSTTYA